MTSVYDVPAQELIAKVANDLKSKIKAPEFSEYVKTGVSRERSPDDKDWWYTRIASMLRTFYTKNALGVNILRGYYGGAKRRGAAPTKHEKGSGKITRLAVQELEKLGYLQKTEKGRIITLKGRQYLDNFAKDLTKKAK